jgi:hypothetical protein
MKTLNRKRPSRQSSNAVPQKYDMRLMRFHLDNGNVVDVNAENTIDAERQLKEACVDRKRIVRISFPDDFTRQTA